MTEQITHFGLRGDKVIPAPTNAKRTFFVGNMQINHVARASLGLPRSASFISSGVLTVDSTLLAWAFYHLGQGLEAELGPNVQQSIIDANSPREARLLDGSTANQNNGRYGVKSSYTFVGDTVVKYLTTAGCGPNDDCCTTKFTGAVDDGFWDVIVPCWDPDGDGSNCEFKGVPYPFVPFSWIVEYDNPKKRK